MPDTIYMLDTNILIDWLVATFPGSLARNFPFVKPDTAARIGEFCEKNHNRIYIPDLVWVEFLSVVLHKDIDVSMDLDTTLNRLRNHEALVQQLELSIDKMPHMDWYLWEGKFSPYPDAVELLRDHRLIDRPAFNWMRIQAKRRSRSEEKLLDGMDSVILIYLNELANQNKNKNVVMYTADFRLWRIFQRIKQYHNSWFSQNTGAVFALFQELECKHCRRRIPVGCLLDKQIVCARCRKNPLL